VSDLKLYIKPYKNPIALETQAIHHIDDQVIANEGIYPIEALDKITEFVESNPDTVVFGHNVNFDMRMLQFMYNDWKREMYTFAHIDTIDLVKTILQKYNPAIKKANLSYIITEYMKDVDLEELRDNVVSYTERFHNHEHDKYNGNREQFEKDTLILEKGILK
jgi:DNA polymerase III alpha subunit (gram-positive type)